MSSRSSGQLRIERRAMRVAAARHLCGQSFVPGVERRELADPALRLRMLAVSSFVQSENIPEAVQFPMLRKQVLATQTRWLDIPDSQRVFLSRYAISDAFTQGVLSAYGCFAIRRCTRA